MVHFASPAAAIELRGICKRFGAVAANQDISLRIEAGTVHGIIGENGAGKSTLMSILYGFYEADAGEIWVNGQLTPVRNSREAIAAGIGMVHQHFMLVDRLSVLDNIMLGAEGGWLLRRQRQRARHELARLAQEFGLHVDPDARVQDLPVGAQQRVEILKALYRRARVLILDEPTAVLTPQETDQLFRVIGQLTEQGVTVLLITHKLREIMAITSRVSVMRQGRIVAERSTLETSAEELAELMVGRKIKPTARAPAAMVPDQTQTPILLEARGLSLSAHTDAPPTADPSGRAMRLSDVNLTLRAGEIVGLAGVSGNGQSELLEILSGLRPVEAGEFTVLGRTVNAQSPCPPDTMRRIGLAHVPEDRLRRAIVTSFSAQESAILGYQDDPALNGRIFSRPQAIRSYCESLMRRLDVRPANPDLKSANFSGGNQQKLVLARELSHQPRVLLVGQPTRGVDIGAIERIHEQLIALRDGGAAVLVVSVELDELLGLCDRIVVMCAGRVVGEVTSQDADERTLGLMMANALPPIATHELAQAGTSSTPLSNAGATHA
jgi:ABC-type uncharacterized transport system ATPase subunit